MIKSSRTKSVPWGYVCGYPTTNGDLYGGGLYAPSSCATLTPQGRAIQDASNRFGNGQTLPFTPCKRGYIPEVRGERMYACHLHNKFRRNRVMKDRWCFRAGEKNLMDFWNNVEGTIVKEEEKEDNGACKNKNTSDGGSDDNHDDDDNNNYYYDDNKSLGQKKCSPSSSSSKKDDSAISNEGSENSPICGRSNKS
mmetsp:Transcript_24359/g.36305  ORF Transcript_24359/g.36305 Transcript_24359/m.36305 type:complete len:195 (-) Transcript_24359:295-879(-)